jgi:hypothetical protein
MRTNSKTLWQRPLFWIIAGLLLVMMLAVIVVGAAGAIYWWNRQNAVPEYAAQTACDHPYFPLRPGATWHYTGDVTVGEERVSTTMTWTVERVSGNETSAGAVVIADYLYDDGAYVVKETVEYNCNADGISRGGSIVNSGSQTINRYTGGSGAYLLPSDTLEPGTAWEHTYAITTDFTPPAVDYAWLYEVTAVEALENPAGTFDAIRIEGSRTQTGTSDTHSSTEWFAYGVGQILSKRSQTADGQEVISTLELNSYSVPSE